MFNASNLKEQLNKLKGYDFIEAENDERASGNMSPTIASTPSFYARLAARALGVNKHDLMDLPIKQFTRIWIETANFLNRDLDEDSITKPDDMKMLTPATSSEN